MLDGLPVVQPGRLDTTSKTKVWNFGAATLRCDTPLVGTDVANKTYVDTQAAAATWGSITGDINNQTDLVTRLGAKEDDVNKVTSISGASTDVEYPSAKLLYDELQLKQNTGAYLTTVATTSPVGGDGTVGSPITVNLSSKQDVLVSGVNIKTINSASILSGGDLVLLTSLSGALLVANNLSDVANRQTALNTLTAVSAATNEYVLTKDTGTGNAIWKASTGSVTKVGTPVDNQVGVWTGDGTIEGTVGLVYTGANLYVTGDIGSTGTRIAKGWFTDLTVTNAITGSVTGNAGTVTNATFTTALTVNTGTLTLTANAANTSVLTIGAGAVSVSGSNTGDQDLSGLVTKATYDAHTILYATTDNTPVALTVGEQAVVGRATGGNISALAIDSDLSSVSANDDTLPSAKATKAYADLRVLKAGDTMTGALTIEHATGIVLGKDDGTNIAGSIKMFAAGANAFYNTFTSGENTANAIYTLPVAMPAVTGYVLSATDAGVMSWVAQSAGSFSWGATATGTSSDGVTLTTGANFSDAIGNALSIVINNTQTLASELRGINIATGTSTDPTVIGLRIESTNGNCININTFGSEMLASGKSGILIGSTGTNNNSAFNYTNLSVINAQNAGVGSNIGIKIDNYSTEFTAATLLGSGLGIVQQGADGVALALYGSSNVNSSTNGLFNITLSDTQSGASTLAKLDCGTSAQANIGLLVNSFGASSDQVGVKVNLSTTGQGSGFEVIGSDNSIDTTGYKISVSSNKAPKVFFGNLTSLDTTGYDCLAFYINNAQSSATLANRTSSSSALSLSRTSTRTSGTTADNYDFQNISRTSVQNGAGGTFTQAGTVLNITNTETQTAGTLTSTVIPLKVTQSSISTGAAIYCSTAGTGKKAIKFDTGFTSDDAPAGASKYVIVDIGGTEYKMLAQATA